MGLVFLNPQDPKTEDLTGWVPQGSDSGPRDGDDFSENCRGAAAQLWFNTLW